MRTETVLSVTFVAVFLAACGSQPSSAGDFQGEQRAVAETVESLQDASRRGEPDRICADLLTASLRAAMAAGSAQCETEIDKALDDADAFELDVEKVTVTGSTATARVKAEDEGSGVARTLGLVKERNRWRIDSLGS